MDRYLYQYMANLIVARKNCIDSNNQEWFDNHTDKLESLLDNLPHGSGLDYTWKYDYNKSNRNRIVLYMSFHAMDDNGYYDGIIDFTVTVKPDLLSIIDLSIIGNFGKYQDVKSYLYDILYESFTQTMPI